MNMLFIIGNLTRAPEMRQTESGIPVCNFTVAVNRRTNGERPEADYFRVTAWRGLAENCYKFLDKGKKCAVVGAVKATGYMDREGNPRAALEMTAMEVEFLTPRAQAEVNPDVPAGMTINTAGGYVEVSDEELHFD